MMLMMLMMLIVVVKMMMMVDLLQKKGGLEALEASLHSQYLWLEHTDAGPHHTWHLKI